jgi:predicted Zn-dependent peptidase
MSGQTEITTLANGLRIATEAMPGVQTATVGVWVDVGARHEAAELNGVAHLLEHMAFKGTERRSARAIAEEIEDVGGQLNAYTSREVTAFYARVLGEDLPLAVDLLGDILLHSTFDEEELARERAVVLQEIGQVQDTPDDLIFDLFQATAYPGQALGRPILGPSEIVAGLPRTALIDYMARHYGPERMVLAAAGKVEHRHLVDLGAGLFGDLGTGASLQVEAGDYRPGELRDARELEQVHVMLGLPAFGYHDPDFYALQVFSTMLGGGMSSRLFQKVREERGLAYSVFSFASSFRDTGLLGVYAGTGESEVAELLPLICNEIQAFVDGPTEVELSRARAQLKASLMMALESSFAQCDELARQLLAFSRRIPDDEVIRKIDAVDLDALRRVGRRILDGNRPVLTAIGPQRRVPDLEAVRGYLC